MLATDQKGNIAELEVAAAASKLGLVVFRPMGEGSRYDLIFDLGGRLCCGCSASGHQDTERCSQFVATQTGAREGLRRRGYTIDEIDAIAAYCPELDRCYLLPASWLDGRQTVHLRISPARNGQEAALNWAHVFDFASVDWSDLEQLGAIAQLEEHRHGMAGAVGSSPTSSIPRSPPVIPSVGAEELRDSLGAYLPRVRDGAQFVVTRRGRPYARLVPP